MALADYALLASDMDGTLLTSDKRLPEETVRDIAAAAERGRTVVLCTGRNAAELEPYREKLPWVRWAATVSGAVVCDLCQGRTVYAAGMDRALVMEMADVAEEYGAMIHLLAEDASIVRADQAAHAEDYGMGHYRELYDAVARQVTDIRAEIARRPSVPKVNQYFRTRADRAAAFARLQGLPVTITLAENAGLELSPPGVDKGVGLRRLAASLGIGMERVIAVGDGDNDLPMLAAAGLAVAVGNAAPEVLSVADVVVADNDHNGVGQAIREYLL